MFNEILPGVISLIIHEFKHLKHLQLPPASSSKEKSQNLYREWLMRKLVVAGLTKVPVGERFKPDVKKTSEVSPFRKSRG